MSKEHWNTPEFKKWFEGSHAANDKGEPLVLYHGSRNAGFHTFDPSLAGDNSGTGAGLGALYFTDSPYNATTYSNTRNEATFHDEDPDYDPDWEYEPTGPGNYHVYLSMKNPLKVDYEGRHWDGTIEGDYDDDSDFYHINNIVQNAIDMGHDGVIASNISDEGRYGQGHGWGNNYIVFHPNQVKSATKNLGTYSTEDDDIRKEELEKSKLKAGLLAAGLVAGGLASKPAQAPAPAKPSVSVQVGKPEMLPPEPNLSIELGKPKILNQSSKANRWTPTNLIEEMHPIAHLESSWGKNMTHAAHSKGDYHTAVGAVGLKPITAHEEYRRTKDLQDKYPGLIEDAGAFTRKLKEDHKFYNDVASAHWNTLRNRFGTPERTAYAWRWGWGSARKASDEEILNDGYVQKFVKLSDKLGKGELTKAAPKLQPEPTPKTDTTYRIQDKATKKPDEPSSPLVAVHSLNSHALDSILDVYQGKIPSPSIAVVNAELDDGDDPANFGEIKLIGRPHLVDPVRGGLTFDADVYTPTHPQVLSVPPRDYDKEALSQFYADQIEHNLGSMPDWDEEEGETAKRIAKILGQREAYKGPLVMANMATSSAFVPWDLSEGGSNYVLAAFAREKGLEFPFDRYGESGRKHFLQTHRKDIVDWMKKHPVLSTMLPEQKLAVGNRIGGENNLVPYTPENALKDMTGKPIRGGEGTGGLGEVRAFGAKRFKTLQEIRQAAGKIVPSKQMSHISDELEREFGNIRMEMTDPDDPRSSPYRSEIFRTMKEAYRTKDFEGALTRHGLDGIRPETKQKLKNFMQKLVDAPTGYFESKPQRIVHLNEFAAALVPDTHVKRYKDKLEAHGIKVIPYGRDTGHKHILQHYTRNEKLRLAEMKKNENGPTMQVVSVACFNKDGKLLFGLRGDSGRWCMPGGKMEAGEDPEKAVIRELLEETNLKPIEMSFLGSRPLRMGNLLVHSFRATVDGTPDASNDPDREFHGFVWADAATPPRAIRENLHNSPDVTLDFLAEAMEESLAKAVLDPSSGYEISAKHLEADNKRKYPITKVTTKLQGKKVGEAVLAHLHKGQLHPESVIVEKSHRRRGIASAMYRMAENVTGRRVVPGPGQTEDGKKLWEGNLAQGQFGDLKKDEPKQAEMFDHAETPTPAGKSRLAVVHNLTHDKLEDLHKLGGKMPAPSLAVASADLGMGDFGSITLIGHPGLVDPEKGTPVYEADAYTPRHPSIKWRDTVPSMDPKKKEAVLDHLHQSLSRWKATNPIETPSSLTYTIKAIHRKDPIPSGLMPVIYEFMTDTGRRKEGVSPEQQIYDEWYRNESYKEFRDNFGKWVDKHPVLSIITKLKPQADIVDHEYSAPIAPYSPKRALREMQKAPIRGGENPDNVGSFGALRAQGAKRFKSLQEIRDSAKKIRPKDDVLTVSSQVGDEFHDIARESWADDVNIVSHRRHSDAIFRAMKEHLQGRDLRNALARHGIPTLSDKTMGRLQEWKKKLLDTPTNYFEAKPQRVVDLREFKAALVHQSGVKHAKSILDEYKIPVIPYRDEEHRRELLAQHTQDHQLRLSEKDPKDQS